MQPLDVPPEPTGVRPVLFMIVGSPAEALMRLFQLTVLLEKLVTFRLQFITGHLPAATSAAAQIILQF
jgi:hypothetical protein